MKGLKTFWIAPVMMLVGLVPAHATISIAYSVDGGAATTCASSATNSAAITCGPSFNTGPMNLITIQNLGASSNSPGNPNIAEDLSSNTGVINNDTVSHTIEFFIFAQGFTAPVTPPDIIANSHIGGTVPTAPGVNSLSFLSCVDASDSPSACAPGSIQVGPETPNVSSVASFNVSQFQTITSLTGTYTISEEETITLAGGQQLNDSASTTLTPVPGVPEPASVLLLGTALSLAGYKLRKRFM